MARTVVIATESRYRTALFGVLVALMASGPYMSGCVTRHTTAGAVPTGRKVSIVEANRQLAASPLAGYAFVDGQLIVKFRPEAAERAAALAGKKDGRITFGTISLDRLFRKYRASGIELLPKAKGDKVGPYLLMLAPDANVIRAAEELSAHPLVEYARPNYELIIPPGSK